MTLRLGLPSKGRLQDAAFAWFEERGIGLHRVGSAREYAGRVDGVSGVELVLLSAGEIPRELAAGRIHLGVTGLDQVAEKLPEGTARPLAPMAFGHADLIVAVPVFWIDVETMDDLDAAAAAFRARHGHRLRVATKYHALARGFFRDHGVADYQLVDSQGATEGTVANGTAEAIVDITSTGETLAANHLRPLRDGLILASEATFFGSPAAPWDAAARTSFGEIAALTGLRAEDGPWT